MFIFKLQPVLTYRKQQEEGKMRELAVINIELLQNNQTIKKFTEERKKAADTLTEISLKSKDVNELKIYEDFIAGRDSDIAQKKEEAMEITKRLTEKQKELVEYLRRRRTMEIYRDRLKESYEAEEAKKERVMADEAASNLFFRVAL